MSDMQQGKVVNLDQIMKKSNRTGKLFPINYVELDNGARINVGFDQPYAVGQTVSIPTEVAYGELQVPRNPPSGGAAPSGGEATGTTAPQPTKPTQNRAPYGRNTRFPVPKDHGDVSIMRQNALTNAVSFLNSRVTGGQDVDDISLDDALEMVIETAYKFAEFTTGQREERMAREIMGLKEEDAA